MGLAASDYNLLRYTRQKNDIGCQLTRLSIQEAALTRDMQKVTRKYQEAINQKTLKWTTNAGASYVDISYSALMYPGSLNNSTPYLLSDRDGYIVVDSRYKQFAEMISPNGAPGGDYESNRGAILSQLTGIPAQDIEMASIAYFAIIENQNEMDSLVKPQPSDYRFYKTNMDKVLEKLGSGYSSGSEVSTSAGVESLVNLVKGLSGYFLEEKSSFEDQCQNICTTEVSYCESQAGEETPKWRKQGDIAKSIVHAFDHWYDIDDASYGEYQGDLQEYETNYNAIDARITAAQEDYSSVFTAEIKNKVDFYDAIFSSIADNGWTYYDRISEPEYLDNMLQNGIFNITNVERDCIRNDYTGEYSYRNYYTTDPALNCSNIVQVNDADKNNQAFIEYENAKNRINEKESRINIRQQNLETEQAAIKQMIESIKNVMNNNVENTFNIFS